jgi:putative thioredoxin
MMASDFIVDVSEADFDYEVLAYSQQVPVLVDFWAEWCAPCRILGPILERITQEANGDFRLARVNVDDNPNLSTRYQVRSIPAVKAFKGGKMVAEFVGAQPEPKVREFLRALVPSQSDLTLEKAFSLLHMQQPKSAEKAFRDVLDQDPDSTMGRLGLAESLLYQGRATESKELLRIFPASREYIIAESVLPLAEALVRLGDKNVAGWNNEDENPLDAAYRNSLRLFERGNIPATLDGLLDILRQDKRFRDGEIRRVILGILELLGESNPLTRQYRSELASVLF